MAGGFVSPSPLLLHRGGAASPSTTGGYLSPIPLLRHRGGAVPVSSTAGYRSRVGFWFGGLCARVGAPAPATSPSPTLGGRPRLTDAVVRHYAERDLLHRQTVLRLIAAIVTSGILDEDD